MSLRLTDAQELAATMPQQLETNVNSAQDPVSGSPDEIDDITQIRFHVGETDIELVEMPQPDGPQLDRSQAAAEKPKSDTHEKAEKKAIQVSHELKDIKEISESAENPIFKRIYRRNRRVDPDAVDEEIKESAEISSLQSPGTAEMESEAYKKLVEAIENHPLFIRDGRLHLDELSYIQKSSLHGDKGFYVFSIPCLIYTLPECLPAGKKPIGKQKWHWEREIISDYMIGTSVGFLFKPCIKPRTGSEPGLEVYSSLPDGQLEYKGTCDSIEDVAYHFEQIMTSDDLIKGIHSLDKDFSLDHEVCVRFLDYPNPHPEVFIEHYKNQIEKRLKNFTDKQHERAKIEGSEAYKKLAQAVETHPLFVNDGHLHLDKLRYIRKSFGFEDHGCYTLCIPCLIYTAPAYLPADKKPIGKQKWITKHSSAKVISDYVIVMEPLCFFKPSIEEKPGFKIYNFTPDGFCGSSDDIIASIDDLVSYVLKTVTSAKLLKDSLSEESDDEDFSADHENYVRFLDSEYTPEELIEHYKNATEKQKNDKVGTLAIASRALDSALSAHKVEVDTLKTELAKTNALLQAALIKIDNLKLESNHGTGLTTHYAGSVKRSAAGRPAINTIYKPRNF